MKEDSLAKKIDRIEAITGKLEDEGIGLEEALKLYEDGMKLLKECSQQLEEAQNTVLKLSQDTMEVETVDGEL